MMRWLISLWRSFTKIALKQSTGKMEKTFFESVYRIIYVTGLSLSHQGFLYQMYSKVVKISIILFLSSEFWYLYSASSMDDFIDNMNVTIIHLIVVYRYCSMIYSKHIYLKLAKSMDTPFFDVSTPSRKNILDFWSKKNKRYFNLLLTLGTCTLAIWYIYPLFDDMEYNFVAAVELPFDHKTPQRYVITYLVVLLMFHFISYFVVVNDLIMQTYLMHLVCQFDILSDCFENIVSDCNASINGLNADYLNEQFKQIYIKRLSSLTQLHQYILGNSSELRQILSAPMLAQLIASGMLICLAGYQVTATITVSVAKFLMSLLYLSYNLFTFYLLCRWCDEIKNQSESIIDAVYFSGWERGIATVPGVRTRLMIIVARASRPIVLTAGGVYDLSLMSYTTLVKTSYSALTVLLRVRRGRNL